MTIERLLQPSDTLRQAIRLAENIKIACELVEEKSPKQNKKLAYLLQNLGHDIDALLAVLDGAMNASRQDGAAQDVGCEVVDDDTDLSGEGKVM